MLKLLYLHVIEQLVNAILFERLTADDSREVHFTAGLRQIWRDLSKAV